MSKFEIKCKKCNSENVKISLESVGSSEGEDESSEWIELNCKDCGESEDVLI